MPLLGRGSWSPCNNVALIETYLPTKCHLNPSNRLAAIDVGGKWGLLCPIWGAGSPSNTMSPGPRPTSVPRGIFGHNRHGRKLGRAPLFGGSWVPIKHNVAWAEAYLHTKWHLHPSYRLVTIYERHRQGRQSTQDKTDH